MGGTGVMLRVLQSRTKRSLRTESATRPPKRKRWPDGVAVGGVERPYRGKGVRWGSEEECEGSVRRLWDLQRGGKHVSGERMEGQSAPLLSAGATEGRTMGRL